VSGFSFEPGFLAIVHSGGRYLRHLDSLIYVLVDDPQAGAEQQPSSPFASETVLRMPDGQTCTIPEPRTVSFQWADDLGLLVVMAQGRRAFYNLHHVESFSAAQC
jgi:hypothetical protein